MDIKKKLVSPVLMWLIVAVGIFLVFRFVPSRLVWERNILTSLLVVPAAAYWLYFFIGAIMVNRKAPLSADMVDKLIIRGVYGKVRHPIYSADIILGWSIFFFCPDVRLLLAAHLMMFTLLFWMRLEEKALISKFGEEYLEYRKNVPRSLPRIRKRKKPR